MTLKLNEVAPDFTQDTTEGPIHFHEWADGHWVVLTARGTITSAR